MFHPSLLIPLGYLIWLWNMAPLMINMMVRFTKRLETGGNLLSSAQLATRHSMNGKPWGSSKRTPVTRTWSGCPPHPKQLPKSPWLVQSHCHDDWMNWGMQAWVTTGASDQFLRRLAIQLMNGACVWNCLGWRELGHFSTWMMLWPPFLQSRLYPTQCVLLLPMYERMTRARYNLGPQKTAVMCCYGADPPDIQNMQCSVYNVLGCFIDEHLILDNQEAFVLNVGKPCSRKFPTCPTSVVFLPCRCRGCRTKGWACNPVWLRVICS